MDHLAELTQAIDGYQSTTAAALEQTTKDIKKLNDRADTLELRMNRPRAGGQDIATCELENKAFTAFLRHGIERMDPYEAPNCSAKSITSSWPMSKLLSSSIAFEQST
jgi:hypothetical protein